jgi:hypothetical protein
MSMMDRIIDIIKRLLQRSACGKKDSLPGIEDIAGETQEQMIHRVLLALGFNHDPDFRFDYHCESSVAHNYVKICGDHLYVKIYAKGQAHTDSDSIPFPLNGAQDLMNQVIYNTYLD